MESSFKLDRTNLNIFLQCGKSFEIVANSTSVFIPQFFSVLHVMYMHTSINPSYIDE